MQVSTVHQVEDETEFVSCLEGVVEIDNKGTIIDFGQHVLFVEGQSFAFF